MLLHIMSLPGYIRRDEPPSTQPYSGSFPLRRVGLLWLRDADFHADAFELRGAGVAKGGGDSFAGALLHTAALGVLVGLMMRIGRWGRLTLRTWFRVAREVGVLEKGRRAGKVGAVNLRHWVRSGIRMDGSRKRWTSETVIVMGEGLFIEIDGLMSALSSYREYLPIRLLHITAHDSYHLRAIHFPLTSATRDIY